MVERCRYPGCSKAAIVRSVFCRKHDKTGMGTEDGSLKYRQPNRGKHLYVIFGVHTRRCKIGSSANVWERLRELQSYSADDLIVWCWALDCGQHEVLVHEHFEEFRLYGEWFSPDVTARIASDIQRSESSSEALASLAKRLARRVQRQCKCPGCGSVAKPLVRVGTRRVIAQCPKCNRFLSSVGRR